MRSFSTKIFLFFFSVFSVFVAVAQPKFTAKVSPEHAGRDEYITLKLTVANGKNIQEIKPPSFRGFSVISGPNQETEMNSVDGVIKQYVSLSYILQPAESGTLVIGSATALVDGKIYKTPPTEITVSSQRSKGKNPANNLSSLLQIPLAAFDPFNQPRVDDSYEDYILRKGESVPEKVNRNMQLKLQTDKNTVYAGEPVTATYKLYTRLRSESSLSQNPSFNGFSVVDMMMQNEPVSSTHEKLNGRDYNVYVIRKAQLYPLQAGPVQLEAASLDNKISFLSEGKAGNIITENVTLSSKPVVINVKPLPEAGKPPDFTGAVGNFKIQTSLENNSFPADETGKLLVTVIGRGNLQLITAPKIKWPAGFDAFDVKLTDNTDNNTVPLSGSKTFEIPFAVQKAGNYHTPEIIFSFFDPATASYKTVTAPGIAFNVVHGTGNRLKKKSAKKTAPILSADSTGNYAISLVLLIGGLIVTGFMIGARKKKKENALINTNKPEKEQEELPSVIPAQTNPLQKSGDCLQKENCSEFYAVINAEMKHFLAGRFAIPESMITCKGLSAAMDKAGVDNTLSLDIHQLLQDIHLQLYTPFEQNETLKEIYARALTIIRQLDMQFT